MRARQTENGKFTSHQNIRTELKWVFRLRVHDRSKLIEADLDDGVKYGCGGYLTAEVDCSKRVNKSEAVVFQYEYIVINKKEKVFS